MKLKGTLNEEIERIKSLFGNDRIYGNLINENKKLISEQGVGKKIAKILSGSDEISKNLTKVLRNVDPIRATKFATTEIKSFGALLDHLNDYDDIWKKLMIPEDFNYLNDTLIDLSTLETKGKIKNLKTMVSKEEFLTAMPREGGMFEIMYDLWDDAVEGKSVKSSDESVVFIKKGNEVLVHKVDSKGDIISTQKIDNQGNKLEDKTYSKEDAKVDVEDYFSGKGTAESSTLSFKIDPNDSPEVTAKKFAEFMETEVGKKINNLGEGSKSVTVKDAEEFTKNGGSILIKNPEDGKWYTVSVIENYVVTVDETGKVVDVRPLPKTEIKNSDTPITDGTKKEGKTTVNNFTNMDKSFAGILRYLFPITSTAVRVFRFIGSGTNIMGKGFSKQRFTFFPGQKFDLTTGKTYLRNFVENPLRILGEQMVFIYAYGTYKEIQRGEENPFSIKTFFTKKATAYGFFLKSTLFDGLVSGIEGLINIFSSPSGESEWCKNYCETEENVDPSKVTESKCYKNCTTKLKNTRTQLETLKTELQNYSNTVKEIEKLNTMDEKEIEKFCSGADGQKLKLTNSLTNLKTGVIDFETEFEKQKNDNQVIGLFINALGLGEKSTPEEILNKVLTPAGEKERISVSQIEEFQKIVDDRCVEWYNREQGGEIPIEQEGDGSEDTEDNNSNSGDEENIEERMVYINITPVEITGEDES